MKGEHMHVQNTLTETKARYGYQVLRIILGSLFIALAANISIPVGPVPVSMQSLSILLLGLTLGSKEATLAVLAYLAEATIGLPVIAGGLSKPLWMFGPTAGFLIGFVPAAYLAGLARPNFLSAVTWFSLALVTIFASGVAYLSIFVGFEQAVQLGLVPFILGDLIKLGLACASLKLYRKI
jgi:biotin transport system substrate-specific component